MEQDNLTNHIASIILQTEGALTAKVSFPSRSSKRLTARLVTGGGQSFLLSSLFIWENFAMTSTVRRITSTIKLSNARMNVSNARVSSRFIRYIRVAAPCICFVPWAALASCRPRPQQQLPVSATGGGRRRCPSPSRLRAGYFQKSFLPEPLLVLCRNRKTSDTG